MIRPKMLTILMNTRFFFFLRYNKLFLDRPIEFSNTNKPILNQSSSKDNIFTWLGLIIEFTNLDDVLRLQLQAFQSNSKLSWELIAF